MNPFDRFTPEYLATPEGLAQLDHMMAEVGATFVTACFARAAAHGGGAEGVRKLMTPGYQNELSTKMTAMSPFGPVVIAVGAGGDAFKDMEAAVE